MMTDVPTVKPEAPIDEVVHLVLNSAWRRAVVITPDRVVQGIITDRRLLTRVAADLRPHLLQALGDVFEAIASRRDTRKPLTAADLMYTDVFTVRADEPAVPAERMWTLLRCNGWGRLDTEQPSLRDFVTGAFLCARAGP
jgi:CBS domain-containing protein